MNYHDVKIPDFISICSKGGPCFSTKIATTHSGREIRIIEKEYALQKYTISNCLLNQSQFNEFNNFFRARFGMLYCFRFKDFADYKVEKAIVAKYSSQVTNFKFQKIYQNGVYTYVRNIIRPIYNSVRVLINETEIAPKIDYNNFSFSIDKALGANEVLSISFDYDVNVRFCSDDFKYNYLTDGSIEIENLELIEVCNGY
jgi:uncharacterized protein (TIGR02217 family)